MESTGSQRDIVNDLSLIYLAFAHGTDGELSDSEIGVIAERLMDWQEEGGREAIIASVRQALRVYNAAEDDSDLNAAIDSIGMSVSREVRSFILDDLMDIALADDIFRHAESDFIKSLSDRWDVRPAAEISGEDEFTVLNKSQVEGGWTPLHDLALLYLTMAYRPDQDLSLDEVEAITRKLAEWMPDRDESDVFHVVQGAINVYGDGADENALNESVESLKKFIPQHQRKALIEDLEFVAQSDGTVLDAERSLIERLREALEVNPSTAVS
jgi:uncharacterized tellurite resistance protein B-like protein